MMLVLSHHHLITTTTYTYHPPSPSTLSIFRNGTYFPSPKNRLTRASKTCWGREQFTSSRLPNKRIRLTDTERNLLREEERINGDKVELAYSAKRKIISRGLSRNRSRNNTRHAAAIQKTADTKTNPECFSYYDTRGFFEKTPKKSARRQFPLTANALRL